MILLHKTEHLAYRIKIKFTDLQCKFLVLFSILCLYNRQRFFFLSSSQLDCHMNALVHVLLFASNLKKKKLNKRRQKGGNVCYKPDGSAGLELCLRNITQVYGCVIKLSVSQLCFTPLGCLISTHPSKNGQICP